MTVTIVGAARPVTGSGEMHPDFHAAPCLVTGGVDTHLDLNVAAALDPVGGLLAVAEFPATLAGHRLLRRGPGPVPAQGRGRGRRGGPPQPAGPPAVRQVRPAVATRGRT